MNSSYFIYGNCDGFRAFLLLAWRVVLGYIKMSVRNQLTHYELEEFFHSLQNLLVLLLNPSLLFDSADTPFSTPRWFRKNSERFVFKTTRFVLVRSTTTFWPRHSLIYCQSTKATLWGLTLFHFACGGGRTTFNRQSGCCEIRCSSHPSLDVSEDLLEVLRNGAGFHWAADSSSSPRAKQNRISPPNKSCQERKNFQFVMGELVFHRHFYIPQNNTSR